VRWAKSIKKHEKLEKEREEKRRKGEEGPGSPESRISGTNRHDAHESSNVLCKGHIVGPVPNNMLDTDEADMMSGVGSGDHLAQALVEDLGTSFAKSGEALARGLSSYPGDYFLTSPKAKWFHSTDGALSSYRPRLPQRSSAVW